MKYSNKIIFVSSFIFITSCASTSNSTIEDISLCKNGWGATQSGKHELAVTLFNQCIKSGNLTDKSLSRTYRNIGVSYRRNGTPELAIPYYDKAITLNPTDVWNDYINRGNALDEMGKYENALKDYDYALQLNPNDGNAYYNKGISYERQNKMDLASFEFRKAFKAGLRTSALKERMQVHKLLDSLL